MRSERADDVLTEQHGGTRRGGASSPGPTVPRACPGPIPTTGGPPHVAETTETITVMTVIAVVAVSIPDQMPRGEEDDDDKCEPVSAVAMAISDGDGCTTTKRLCGLWPLLQPLSSLRISLSWRPCTRRRGTRRPLLQLHQGSDAWFRREVVPF